MLMINDTKTQCNGTFLRQRLRKATTKVLKNVQLCKLIKRRFIF